MKQRLSPCTTTILTFEYRSEESLQQVYKVICDFIDYEQNATGDIEEEQHIELDGLVLEFMVDPGLEDEFTDLVPYEVIDDGRYYVKFRVFLLNVEPYDPEHMPKIIQNYRDYIGL